jgi:hypothetical protein|nr:Rep family protein [uncultured Acetatifactor sp.]
MPRKHLDTAGTKPPHVHLLLKFKKKQPQKLGYVAQWFKVPENFINCKGKSWESACLYLAHINAPDKFRYAIADVSEALTTMNSSKNTWLNRRMKRRTMGKTARPKGRRKRNPPLRL